MKLESYLMKEINAKSERWKNNPLRRDFIFRINSKLNRNAVIDDAELKRLKELYGEATDPQRLKW